MSTYFLTGPKVIIWGSGSKGGCYALGVIASNLFLLPKEEIQEKLKFKIIEPYNVEKDTNEHIKVKITHKFFDSPKKINTSSLGELSKEENFKANNGGTCFSTTKNWFDYFLINTHEIINQKNDNERNSSFSLNTILYGPPGTGKTYKTTELAVNIIEGLVDDDDIDEDSNDNLIENDFNKEENRALAELIKSKVLELPNINHCEYLQKKNYIQFIPWRTQFSKGGSRVHFEIIPHKKRFMFDLELEEHYQKKLSEILIKNSDKINAQAEMGQYKKMFIGRRFISLKTYNSNNEMVSDFLKFIKIMMEILKEENFLDLLKKDEVL